MLEVHGQKKTSQERITRVASFWPKFAKMLEVYAQAKSRQEMVTRFAKKGDEGYEFQKWVHENVGWADRWKRKMKPSKKGSRGLWFSDLSLWKCWKCADRRKAGKEESQDLRKRVMRVASFLPEFVRMLEVRRRSWQFTAWVRENVGCADRRKPGKKVSQGLRISDPSLRNQTSYKAGFCLFVHFQHGCR